MTQKSLEKLLKVWQHRLRLEDWKITIGFYEMASKDHYGGADTKTTFLEADIGINEDLTDLQEIEETLVHELLHVRFPHFNTEANMLDPKTLLGYEFEVGIDMVSRALVEAYSE